jgi:phosphatidylserine/phosphatidylglycerophosphate/cardiolipin synthase-like enzyme
LAAAQYDLKVIMYSAGIPSGRTHAMYSTTWRELKAAVLRIKSTRIILSAWPDSNPQSQVTSQVKTLLESLGAKVAIARKGEIMHPKSWLFDNQKLIIGSHNFTEAGFIRARNISYIGQDEAEATQFNDYFNREWSRLTQLKIGA